MAQEHIEIWLCVDCMFAEELGELPEDEERAEEVEEGLERLMKAGEIWANFGGTDEYDGYEEFSWSQCDCCGDTLGGSRYRYALWPKTK